MPKSKLKPSEWIAKKAEKNIEDLSGSGFMGDRYVVGMVSAILDYLDQQEDNLTK